MFRLSQFHLKLIEWLKSTPTCMFAWSRFSFQKGITPDSTRRQLLSWLESLPQLRDLSVSRPSKRQMWGIQVPGDETQMIYVWLDALVNYLTPHRASDGACEIPSESIHVIGKDILKFYSQNSANIVMSRFHAIYWPALLMALELPLPKQLIVHGHWTVNHVKISKSLGNGVNPMEIISQYGVDAVRYFLLRDGRLYADNGSLV